MTSTNWPVRVFYVRLNDSNRVLFQTGAMSSRHSKLRIGIVGAGSIVKTRHLPALRRIPDVEVVAICNSTYESSETFCKEQLPNAKVYGNWAELVSDHEIDIVWIGTPPYLHSTITLSALE
ncbi:MAG: Gfo/Idh/MocA family oxidoreductase, partial [Verrucomicrobia bacterium]|nr:Gfo/Idh/MocA family oxidoreductase [Verrucomicrobiota bacterium]